LFILHPGAETIHIKASIWIRRGTISKSLYLIFRSTADFGSLEDEQEWESIKRTDNALVIALGLYANKYRDRDLRDCRGFSDHPDLLVYRVDDERVPGIWNELGHRRPMTPTWFIFSSLLDKEKVGPGEGS
jgi:hypothetical protein